MRGIHGLTGDQRLQLNHGLAAFQRGHRGAAVTVQPSTLVERNRPGDRGSQFGIFVGGVETTAGRERSAYGRPTVQFCPFDSEFRCLNVELCPQNAGVAADSEIFGILRSRRDLRWIWRGLQVLRHVADNSLVGLLRYPQQGLVPFQIAYCGC